MWGRSGLLSKSLGNTIDPSACFSEVGKYDGTVSVILQAIYSSNII